MNEYATQTMVRNLLMYHAQVILEDLNLSGLVSSIQASQLVFYHLNSVADNYVRIVRCRCDYNHLFLPSSLKASISFDTPHRIDFLQK